MTGTAAAVTTAGNIRVLPPREARRIAAGEVVDRPAALIREFLDNAIDAGAANIDVVIEEGGSKKAEVADDGRGMERDDLQVCWLAHATSKIRSLDDLSTAETLGFRGEALAAAAAVARLEIISNSGSAQAWRLDVGPGDNHPPQVTPASRTRGSTVRALDLYDTVPARKRFLKRESSEAALCRQVFIEKALAFPWISFRFTRDGRLKDMLPAAASKKERFAAALLEPREKTFLHELHVEGDGFSADVVTGGPELFRLDRRMLYIFANGRRIQEYSFMMALEYGVQGWFPNGTHPVGAVYIDIDPALADFNIHPAKREARFRDPGAIHHAISSGLRDFCHRPGLKNGITVPANHEQETRDSAVNALLDTIPGFAAAPEQPRGVAGVHAANSGYIDNTFYQKFSADINSLKAAADSRGAVAEKAPVYGEARYAGKIFGLFILAEWGDKLFIIDQHAAHERILYNRFLAPPIPSQELLIPIPFSARSEAENSFLEAKREELAALAIVINKDGDGWRIDALPQGWHKSDAETVREILALNAASENMAERWAATLCCHNAVRDGDYLDDAAALALAREALNLPDPRCPHGRPVWTEISREALCKAVRRS